MTQRIKTKRIRLPLLDDEAINDRVLKMLDHLGSMKAHGHMDAKQYNEALIDLSKWAWSKRSMAK